MGPGILRLDHEIVACLKELGCSEEGWRQGSSSRIHECQRSSRRISIPRGGPGMELPTPSLAVLNTRKGITHGTKLGCERS